MSLRTLLTKLLNDLSAALSALGYCAIFSIFMVNSNQGQAKPAASSTFAPHTCAKWIKTTGIVDLYDEPRSQLMEVAEGGSIPCGGWVSTRDGWASIRTHLGHVIFLGSQSFVQIVDWNAETLHPREHILLLRGQIFAHAPLGTGELKILTSNARTQFKASSGIVVYQSKNDISQLIALEGSSVIENRFESTRSNTVQPGEASTLDFSLERTLPSASQAISLAALKEKINQLNLPHDFTQKAIKKAVMRKERLFAAALVPDSHEVSAEDLLPSELAHSSDHGSEKNPDRSPAHAHREKKSSYDEGKSPSLHGSEHATPHSVGANHKGTHKKPSEDLHLADQTWKKKLLGGEDADPQLFHPKSHSKLAHSKGKSLHPGKGHSAADRIPSSQSPDWDADELKEKKRILEELSEDP